MRSTIVKSLLLALSIASISLATSSFPKFVPSIPPAAAIQKAANISTGNPAHCPAGTKYFPQAIDHATFTGNYNASNLTFLQQFEVNDTYYKPGGPIIFMQGVESASLNCVDFSISVEWAKELNGLMVAIEHRYFGISIPYGLQYSEYSTWDTSLLKPLTMQNALLDGLNLLNWIKTVAYPSTIDSKVLLLSGTSI